MSKSSKITRNNTKEVNLIILKVFKHKKDQVLHETRVLDLLKKYGKTKSLLVVSVVSNMLVLCATKRVVHALIVVNMVILFKIVHYQRIFKHKN